MLKAMWKHCEIWLQYNIIRYKKMIPQGKGAIPSRSKLQTVDARAARQRAEGTGHQDQGVSASLSGVRHASPRQSWRQLSGWRRHEFVTPRPRWNERIQIKIPKAKSETRESCRCIRTCHVTPQPCSADGFFDLKAGWCCFVVREKHCIMAPDKLSKLFFFLFDNNNWHMNWEV